MTSNDMGRPKVWTIMALLKWSTNYFKSHDIESPRSASEILLAHSLKLNRIDLYLKYDKPLTSRELSDYKVLIKRRVNKEPVAYIIEEREFWSLNFKVSSSVLIPRPETECLVEETFRLIDKADSQRPLRILELGTGSGAIIVTLAHKQPDFNYFASDISLQAIKVAQQNALKHKVDDRIAFFACDWFSAIDSNSSEMDFILSNPPYIKSDDLKSLQSEVKDFEPRVALDGSIDGVAAIRRILNKSFSYLRDGGFVLMEIGADQKKAVLDIVHDLNCFEDVAVLTDYSGRDRILRAKKRQSD